MLRIAIVVSTCIAVVLSVALLQVEVVFVRYPDDCCPQCCTRKCGCINQLSSTRIGQKFWALRCYAFKLIEHKYFETFIITMIVTSSLALAVEDIHYEKPERATLKMIMTYLDKFYTVVFVLEMFLKWLAFGFKKYFTDSWCWLDFVIVTVCNRNSKYTERFVELLACCRSHLSLWLRRKSHLWRT